MNYPSDRDFEDARSGPSRHVFQGVTIPTDMAEEVAMACEMRANYIETGSPLANKNDYVKRAGLGVSSGEITRALNRVSNLTELQVKLIARLRETAERIRRGG